MPLLRHEPSAQVIQHAHARIAPHVVRTPLLSSVELNERFGARIYFKPENLQRTGAFKFRGAINRLLQLTDVESAAGVVTWSSGNHGLAISCGARILGVKATVLMPQDAPRIKVDGVRANGATVHLYDKRTENREAIGRAIAAQTGAVIVPPYDDPYGIAGQSTVGVEIAEQVAENGQRLDGLLLPCSGGGLASGAACGVHMLSPETSVFTVEPQSYDCVARSLAAGQAVAAPADCTSICDALLVATPGNMTWPLCQKHMAGALTVTDAEVLAAVRFAWGQLKLVVEPGGVAALAAVLAGKADVAGKTVVVVLSGGNVDAGTFADLIQTDDRRP